jgi:hypothetical protein
LLQLPLILSATRLFPSSAFLASTSALEMDEVIDLYQSSIAEIEDAQSADPAKPDAAQLALLLRGLVRSLGPIVPKLSDEVKGSLKGDLAYIGWDTKTNAACRSKPPSAEEVLTVLRVTCWRAVESLQFAEGDPLIGKNVTLAGLSTETLNGSTGIVMSFDEEKDRYNVCLSSGARSGDKVGIKAENLTEAAAENENAATQAAADIAKSDPEIAKMVAAFQTQADVAAGSAAAGGGAAAAEAEEEGGAATPPAPPVPGGGGGGGDSAGAAAADGASA